MLDLAGHVNNQYETCLWMLIKHGKSENEAQEILKVLIACPNHMLQKCLYKFSVLCLLNSICQLCRALKNKRKTSFSFNSLVSTIRNFLKCFVRDLVFLKLR